MSFRHSADSGSATALTRSAPPAGASASRMRSAWTWNFASQLSRTARGDTDGNIAARSAMCASPSLRIMLWPIRRFINPAGWCEEDRRSYDILRLAGAAERGVVDEDFDQLRISGAHLLVQRRFDEARADRIDPHAVLAEFGRQRAGQAEHAVLRSGVGRRARRAQ